MIESNVAVGLDGGVNMLIAHRLDAKAAHSRATVCNPCPAARLSLIIAALSLRAADDIIDKVLNCASDAFGSP
jgi:hypothetical protein